MNWQWSDKKLLPLVSQVRLRQGQLLGGLLTLGFDLNVGWCSKKYAGIRHSHN
ncbi:hypothetical protein ACTXMT_12840 [Psychrobacter faecalis]|uniref:hypothetical protein n=1 Tax=Psychrobacter faecalis TaxID=180588 RepID=UPI003FD56E98